MNRVMASALALPPGSPSASPALPGGVLGGALDLARRRARFLVAVGVVGAFPRVHCGEAGRYAGGAHLIRLPSRVTGSWARPPAVTAAPGAFSTERCPTSVMHCSG